MKVAGSASTARAVDRGKNTPDDLQFGFGQTANAFPVVQSVQVVADGDAVRVGEFAVTAHLIPGALGSGGRNADFRRRLCGKASRIVDLNRFSRRIL